MPNPHLPKPLADLIFGTDDADLLVRLRRKDPKAVGLLYDRYGKTAYSLAYKILGDVQSAESAVAESFLKCWNRISSFHQARGGALGAWLLLTTHVTSIEHRKGRQARADEWAAEPSPLEQATVFHGWSKELDGDHVQALFWELNKLEYQERKLLDAAFSKGSNSAELMAELACSKAELERLISSAVDKMANVQ